MYGLIDPNEMQHGFIGTSGMEGHLTPFQWPVLVGTSWTCSMEQKLTLIFFTIFTSIYFLYNICNYKFTN